MRKKRTLLCILLALAAMVMNGCWDQEDIEKKNIVTAVMVDKTEDGYTFHIEVASITGGGGGGGTGQGTAPKSVVFHGEGFTFVDAREELERQSDRNIYLGGVQSVIFTEKLAYAGIESYMHRFRENPEYRKTSMVVITGEKFEDLFGIAPENNTLVGRTIDETITSLVDIGQLFPVTMGHVLDVMARPYKGYLIPHISVRNKNIQVDGYCVMEGGTSKGFIPLEGSEGIVYIRGNARPYQYAMPYEQNHATLELRMKKKPTEVSYRDGKIRLGLRFDCNARLMSFTGGVVVTDEMRQKIAAELKKQLLEDYTRVIKTSQQGYKCDYLMLHEAFRIKYPDEFKKMDWAVEYPKAEITVDMDVEVRRGHIDYEPE